MNYFVHDLIRRGIIAGAFFLFAAACNNGLTKPAAALPTLAQLPTDTPFLTLAPTSTPNLTPSATSALIAAASALPPPTSTVLASQNADQPPLTIPVPSGWRSTYQRLPILDQTGEVTINVAAYAGPVAGNGTGFIYILWNYPSLVPVNPVALPTSATDLLQQQMYSDGLRLLQGSVMDAACTFGNYGHTTFSIGKQTAFGQLFQAVSCPQNQPDVAGWYAGVRPNSQSLMFYAYVQPASDFNIGRPDIQRILDGITFSDGQANPIATTIPISPTTIPTGTPELN